MRLLIAVSACVVLLAPVVSPAQPSSSNSRLDNAIAVIVNDAVITYADIDHAREQLGYNPTFTMEQGIRRFVEWYRKQHTGP